MRFAGMSLWIVLPIVGWSGAPVGYKELQVDQTHPVEIREGLFDFGRDGVGWLELHGAAPGDYSLVFGELTNAQGVVTNAYPKSAIRCHRFAGRVDAARFRVPVPPDKLNLVGWDPKAPAVRLPRRFGTVMPFRYVQIERSPARLTAANLVRHMIHYPMDLSQADFICDNGTLNAVYELCKYSVFATSFCGVYVDGDRERTPYEGDAYINQLCQYAIDADYSLARRSIEWLLEHPTWPTEWKQHAVKMVWTDWMWTGDDGFVRRHFDQLVNEKLLLQYARDDGLLVTGGELRKGCRIPGGGDLVDWPESERDGFEFRPVNAVVNAFHYRNLLELSDLARAVGKDSDFYENRARRVRDSFRASFFDLESGLFVDGEGSSHHSLHANAAALAFGLVDDRERESVIRFLEARGMACSTYFAQYLLEALCRADRVDLAVRLMASSGPRSWKAMLDFGSTISMESWNMCVKANQDLNHAWGSVPLNILVRYVLGVMPMEPGFARISIEPRLGTLKWVKGSVPTVWGTIRVFATQNRLELTVPASTRIRWRGRTLDVGRGTHVL